MGIQFIGVSEVENYLNKENVEFIDLRDTKEYRKRHIRGAKSMPYDSFMKAFTTLSKKKIYILYCDRGSNEHSGCICHAKIRLQMHVACRWNQSF